jgi:hypothetical protein
VRRHSYSAACLVWTPSNGNSVPLRVDGNGSAIYEQTIKYGSRNMVCAASQPSCADPTSDAGLGIYHEQSVIKFVRLVE